MSRSLFARLAGILLVALGLAMGLSVWLQSDEHAHQLRQARSRSYADQVASAVQLLEATPPAQLSAAAAALARAGLRVQTLTPGEVAANTPRGALADVLAQRLGSARDLRNRGGGGGSSSGGGSGHSVVEGGSTQRSVDVHLIDGRWMRLTEAAPTLDAAPAWSWVLLAQLGVLFAGVALASLVAVRQATAPLRVLARAAERLGNNINTEPLPEGGSAEVRAAAHAFNTLQQRLQTLLQERERALAAVSHDLRTPLTRMRLRAELVEDDALRADLARDVEGMARLIDTTLDYLRQRQTQEVPQWVDVDALIDQLVADAALQGRAITRAGLVNEKWFVRETGLRRALQNLINNAQRYGAPPIVVHASLRQDAWRAAPCKTDLTGPGHADAASAAAGATTPVSNATPHQIVGGPHDASSRVGIACSADPRCLVLSVCDHGPGIPTDQIAHVTQAYVRLDAARSHPEQGVGLGLTIVEEVARQHGGTLRLTNRDHGGLCAELVLPVAG